VCTDLRNARAEVLDEEVVTDGQFASSRSPADLPAFCAAIIQGPGKVVFMQLEVA